LFFLDIEPHLSILPSVKYGISTAYIPRLVL
jgi:hypothetical protein